MSLVTKSNTSDHHDSIINKNEPHESALYHEISYKIHTSYLQPLLMKHSQNQPIYLEDLQQSHENFQKIVSQLRQQHNTATPTQPIINDNNRIVEQMHQSQLGAYQTAARQSLKQTFSSTTFPEVLITETEEEYVKRCGSLLKAHIQSKKSQWQIDEEWSKEFLWVPYTSAAVKLFKIALKQRSNDTSNNSIRDRSQKTSTSSVIEGDKKTEGGKTNANDVNSSCGTLIKENVELNSITENEVALPLSTVMEEKTNEKSMTSSSTPIKASLEKNLQVATPKSLSFNTKKTVPHSENKTSCLVKDLSTNVRPNSSKALIVYTNGTKQLSSSILNLTVLPMSTSKPIISNIASTPTTSLSQECNQNSEESIDQQSDELQEYDGVLTEEGEYIENDNKQTNTKEVNVESVTELGTQIQTRKKGQDTLPSNNKRKLLLNNIVPSKRKNSEGSTIAKTVQTAVRRKQPQDHTNNKAQQQQQQQPGNKRKIPTGSRGRKMPRTGNVAPSNPNMNGSNKQKHSTPAITHKPGVTKRKNKGRGMRGVRQFL